MSHEIETHADGTASFVSARQDAWHRLGTVLDHTFTAEEAMRYAFLGGWDVRKTSLTTTVLGEDGVSTIEVPDNYATVRTNPKTNQPEVLGVVGNWYEPVQNEAHADLLDAVVDESGAHFETAGSLQGGKHVFITMKLPEAMMVGGVDQTDVYIAGLNSHDGTSAFRLLVTPVRIVCANTQAAALRNHQSSFVIRHTNSATGRIAQARQALNLTWKYVEAFEAEANKMIEAPYRPVDWANLLKRVFPVTDEMSKRAQSNRQVTVDTLNGLFFDSDTQANCRNTRWGAYNAFTEYYDHVLDVRDKDNADDARALRTITGKYVIRAKEDIFNMLKVG
jgi:phage/plasmid-like protein (TIGR03299 family)